MMKEDIHIFTGMRRDSHPIKQNAQMLWNCLNMRLTSRNESIKNDKIESNTMLSLTNESSTKELLNLSKLVKEYFYNNTSNNEIPNIDYIGHTVLGKYIILFVKAYFHNLNLASETDEYRNIIFRIDTSKLNNLNDTKDSICILYKGNNLDFNTKNPIQAIGIYESEYIQKVYWVDGKNQPRVINIAKPELECSRNKSYNEIDHTKLYKDAPFNFVPELELNENIEITRRFDVAGSFHSGVIQYAFTYYYKYGQESNIFYTSPLMYISYPDRGAKEDDIVNCGFEICISNFEEKFDYIRVYSILRTTKDTTPSVRRVADLEIHKDSSKSKTTTPYSTGEENQPQNDQESNTEEDSPIIRFIDTGTTGDSVDPQSLLFLGGQSVVAGCISTMENTMFLGDMEYKKNPTVDKDFSNVKIEDSIIQHSVDDSNPESYWNKNLLNRNFATFKCGETYRFGVQFQYKDGSWSKPIWIKDHPIEKRAELKFNKVYKLGTVKCSAALPVNNIKEEGYLRVRPLIALPSTKDRKILAQGFLCPTVFQLNNRINNSPFSQSSWFLRPFMANRSKTSYPEYLHNNVLDTEHSTDGVPSYHAEIQNMIYDGVQQSLNYRRTYVYDDSNYEIAKVVNGKATINYKGTQTHSININDKILNIDNKTVKYVIGIDQNGNFIVETNDKDIRKITKQKLDEGAVSLERVIEDQIKEYKNAYYVDQSILTFHSPDIEFNEEIQNIIDNNTSLKLEIIGVANFNLCFSAADITLSSVTAGTGGSLNPKLTLKGGESLVSGAYFYDKAIDDSGKKDGDDTLHLESLFPSRDFSWVIYPWHRSGSLNNDVNRPSGMGQRTSILKKKVLSNLHYANNNFYYIDSKSPDDSKDTTQFQIFNSNELSLNKFKSGVTTDKDISYYGNVDTVNPTYKDYLVMVTGNNSNSGNDDTYPVGGIFDKAFPISELTIKGEEWFGNCDSKLKKYSDPIRIRYKSTPHIVVKLPDDTIIGGAITSHYYPNLDIRNSEFWTGRYTNSGKYEQIIEPVKLKNQDSKRAPVFKGESISKNDKGKYDSSISLDSYLFIAEITQDVPKIYGGESKEALQSNIWIPAGESKKIEGELVTVEWTTGDTWYQRYDCLKTYPFSQDDENQIVEIGSVILETRFNLDGRYDRNKGLIDNTKVSPLNFNLMNPVYSQLDNFFNYRIMDEDYYSQNHYPNQIAWSLPKNNGATKDEWTSINLANTLDLDGSQGKVVNIASYNDTLLAFQESGIQQLIFNPRVQVQASDGVPIEIANSQKMQGTRVISDTIGCQDKFSMASSPYGIYFVDNNNASVFLFDGKINDIGTNLGQLYWFRENHSDYTWLYSPESNKDYWNKYNSIRVAYDPKYKDLYFTPGVSVMSNDMKHGTYDYSRKTLCYSELLGKFSGLFSYDGTVLVPTDNRLFSLTSKWIYSTQSSKWLKESGLYLYEHVWGKGGTEIFGKKRPYSFSFISNQVGTMNKTFDTVELRANLYNVIDDFKGAAIEGTDVTHSVQKGQPFNYIRVETEAQDTGEVYFDNNSLKKKFNIWRGLIPRDQNSSNGRARIKNTWAKVTLGYDPNKTYDENDGRENMENPYTILHDITVKYSI